jgi:hypothetical protein
MTTPQIVVLTVLAALIIIGYLGTNLSLKENNRLAYGAVQLISTGLLFTITIIITFDRQRCIEESKGKCPEYEHIDAYRLKE